MECPHCRKEISNTALRCKYCRHLVNGQIRKVPSVFLKRLYGIFSNACNVFFLKEKNVNACPWTFWDVLVLSAIILVLAFNDLFLLGTNILKFLRLHFFIFTKEPKLLYYLTVYLSTIIFKGISLVFLIGIVAARRVSFWRSVVTIGKIPDFRSWWMPLYIMVCILLSMANRANPLVPRIPFDSVFTDAKIIGNIVVILSVLAAAPLAEEILFRGFLFPAVNKYFGVFFSIFFTSLLFTLAHYPHVKDDYMFMGMIFFLGSMITYAKAKTGSTAACVILHFTYNLVSVGMGFMDQILRY